MTDVSADSRVYRRLLGIGLWRRLTVTSGFQRLSVAMAPIALVLAGHSATGSFSVGALMASAYTFADGFASPLSGRLMDRIELRRGVSLEMGAAGLLLMALAGLAAIRAPGPALIVMSAVAGVAPAGVMGGLRAYLQRIVPADLRERAFALDATLLELEWMCAPALVAAVGFIGAPVLAIVLMALAAFGALGSARLLAPQPPSGEASAGGAWRNPKALPTYFVSAVMGYAEGTINVALAPLMPAVGARPATAGLLIALLSLSSAVGGFGYAAYEGRRPGNPERRSNIAILLLGVCTAFVAFAPSVGLVAVAVAACGLWIAPLLTMRNLILGRLLPASQLSEGFSTLSAVGQIGYGISGVVTGIVLGSTGARVCFVIAAAFTVVSGVAVMLLGRFRPTFQRDPSSAM